MIFRKRQERFTRGQLVEVRAGAEIAATLDANGKLDGMPFMPEMAQYCGRRFRVLRRVTRTCVVDHSMRGMRSTVLLQDSRCDGAAHDGCERGCTLFWKDAWLRPVADDGALPPAGGADGVHSLAQLPTRHGDTGRYICQSTKLHSATHPMSRWSMLPFLREIRAGDLSVAGFLRIAVRTVLTRLMGRRPGTILRGAASTAKPARGNLDLKAGEWVQVKLSHEIQAALDHTGRNNGLSFRPTMLPALGGRYRVAHPVRRIILEETGQMVTLSNTVALRDVVCEGTCVANCPRAELLFWRESWLRRLVPPSAVRPRPSLPKPGQRHHHAGEERPVGRGGIQAARETGVE
jgi:hypothetical protein